MAKENDLSSLIRDAIDYDNDYDLRFIPAQTQTETPDLGEVYEFITPLQHFIEPSNEMTHKDLYDLLASWDLTYLYYKCINKRVFYKNLPHLTQRHINMMFEKNEVGDQASFEYFLLKWQNNNSPKKESFSNDEYEEENPIVAEDDLENLADKSGPSSSTELMNAKSILMRTEIGRFIIEEYKNLGKLNDQSRSRICQLIADYYVTERNIKPGVAICRKITQQTLAIFPSELYETYFLHRGVQTPQGKLYDKMFNTRKRQTRFLNNNKVQNLTENLKNQKSATYNESSIISTDNHIKQDANTMQALMAELKHLRSPWKDVVTKWKQTSYYRVKQMMDNEDYTMENLLQNWPLYEHAQVPELITIDFYHCFKTKHTIYTNWERFSKKIPDIYQHYVKDPAEKSILNKLISNRDKINIDAYNLELLFTIPQILPTNVQKNQKGTKLDAQSAFIIKALNSNELQEKLDKLNKICLKNKKRLQPLIAAIGSHCDYTEFFVIFDSIKYKLGSFLEAVNICYI